MKSKLLKTPEEISKNHYLLTLQTDSIECTPGQFINLKINQQNDPLLRRPFSIYDFKDNILEIVVQIIGTGTNMIKSFTQNSEIDILAPLGKGFTLLENKKVLLVGGGVGNAPLYFLAKELKKLNCETTYIYGSRDNELVYLKDKYSGAVDRFILTTDNGSAGEKGFVTDAAKRLLESEKFDLAYICGPTPMMEAMSNLAENYQLPTEVSLENYFGCGIGICSGCTVQTDQGQKRACVDGPVFKGESLIWNSIAD